jgi:SAM-dependent methyltransferase
VCAFEVLEHLEDDRAAVWEWSRHARAGGWLLVSVPAGAGRFGRADAEAGHYRRYDRAGLVDVLDSAGLDKVEVITYGFPLGYALEAFRNAYSRRTARAHTLEERTAASGRWLQPPESAALITRVASLPFRYAQRPFSHTHWGTGLVARARRPR